jgi:glycosyltransferase involved in cell wall biosynthesis
MSVALIAHYLGPRLGIGQYFQRLLPYLVSELNKNKIAVQIFASPNAFEKTPALQELKDLVQIVSPLDYAPAQRYLWCITSFKNYCRQASVDYVVWLSNPIVLPWHPPSLAVIHDVNEWKAQAKYGDRLKTTLRSLIYLDTSFNAARKLVAVSTATAKDILYFRPSQQIKSKLSAIANGADSPLLNLPPVTINAPTNPFLLSVGRIDPAAKNLPQAVELVAKMRLQTQQPWELHLIGGMNTTTQSAGEVFLESVKNLPWVIYHGYAGDLELAQWYRQANGIVFLSDNEGFGFPIAEAASFKRWVVISRHNEAGIEAGGEAIISINPQQPEEAASLVLSQLKAQEFPNVSLALPSWQDAAIAYTEEIKQLKKN